MGLSRYKARLVAQGFSQEQQLDYNETFSPVVHHTTIKLVLALAVAKHWELRQLDVKNAFLPDDLQKEVYMKQPQGVEDSKHHFHVCKLLKSLYCLNLKQALCAWNAKFTGYLPTLGFTLSHYDMSLFVKHTVTDIVLLLLYVDDIIVIGSSSTLVQSMITDLGAAFDMKDMGKLTFFFLDWRFHTFQMATFLSTRLSIFAISSRRQPWSSVNLVQHQPNLINNFIKMKVLLFQILPLIAVLWGLFSISLSLGLISPMLSILSASL